MKLNEIFEMLNEYVGVIDQGSINWDRLDFALLVLSSKDEATRLARALKAKASPSEIKKALKMGKERPNRMAYWFVQALEEKSKVKV